MSLKIHRPPEGEQPKRPLRDKQFSLRTLFFASTLLALVVAGFSKVGVEGAVGMLFGAWLATVGTHLLFAGYRATSQRLMTLIAGAGLSLLGLAALLSLAMTDETISISEYSWLFEFNPIAWLAIGFAGFVIWDIVRTKWDISFDVTRDGIRREKGIPEQKLAIVREFFQQTDLSTSTKLKVRAKRGQDGNLIVRCYGNVPRAEHQRIRNFLVDTL